MQPVPLMLPVGWLILLAPLGMWLWFKGQQRWPMPFLGINLLVFGGLLGLTAYHLQPAWINTWRTWTIGLPIISAPFAVIGLGPFALWSWNRVSQQWPRALVIPNLLLTGGILWLVLDRTRPIWMSQFRSIWGDAFVGFDIALIVVALPLTVWLWQKGSRRWPRVWSALHTLVLGVGLWWIAERTRILWEASWQRVFTDSPAYVPLTIGLSLPALWLWTQLRKRWPRAVAFVSMIVISAVLFWLTGQLLPATTYSPRALVAALPLVIAGWGFVLHHHPRLGWALTFLLIVASGLVLWLAPGLLGVLASNALSWLAEQGVPI